MKKLLSVSALLLALLFGARDAEAAGASPANMTASSAIVGAQIVWCPVGLTADFKCTFTQIDAFINAQFSGDFTVGSTGAATLATVNSNVGSFGSATTCIVTTQNAKGLTTAISAVTCTPAIGSITGLGAGVATAAANATNATGGLVTFGGSGGTLTANITGNAATVTTNANSTGDVTSVGNVTTLTNAPVIAKVLTGFTSGAGTVSAADSILSALQKINGNDALKLPLTGGTVSGALTLGSTLNANALATTGTIAGSLCRDASGNVIFNSAANCFVGGGSAGGTANQVQWNSAGSLAGFTFSGDMTLVPSTGVATVTKTGGVAFGALATVTPGTGVATALGVNVGTAGAPVVNGGALGTPSSGVGTNLTGTAAGLTAGNVTTNANLTGDVTSVGNATTLTNAPVIAKVLTGFTSGAGTVSAADSILSALQKINGNDALKAPLASPALTGTPTAPTATVGTNTTQVATTAFVLANAGSGSGTVTSVSSGCGTTTGGSPITTTGTVAAAITRRPNTATTDAIISTDCGNIVSESNAASIAVSIAQAGTTGFAAGTYFELCNIGVGTATVTPTTSTIGGASTYALPGGTTAAPKCVGIQSDGTNYNVVPDWFAVGTAAAQNTGTSGATLPFLNGTNTWSGTQTFGSVFGSVTTQSGTTYTLASTDCGTEIAFTNAAAVTVTIPAALTTGCNIAILQTTSAGQVTVTGTAVSAATLHSGHSYTKTFGQWAVIGINIYTTGVAILTGDGA